MVQLLEARGDDEISLAHLLSKDDDAGAYAWGKTAWLRVRPYFEEVLTGHREVQIVDLCSSYPVFAQILREQYRAGCKDQAVGIAGKLSRNLYLPSKKRSAYGLYPSLGGLDMREILALRTCLGEKRSLGRRLLEAVIQDALYDPTDLDFQDEAETRSRLQAQFRERLGQSTVIYHRITEREELRGMGRWHTIARQYQWETLEDEVGKYIIDPIQKKLFLSELINYLTEECLPIKRNFQVRSLDVRDPEEIKAQAERSFPVSYQNTLFFERASDLSTARHLQQSIFDLKIADNSITLFTSFEGWPFWFSGTSLEDHAKVVRGLVKALRPGGIAVIFPWQIHESNDANNQVLEQTEGLFSELDVTVSQKIISREELETSMGLREADLTGRSPLFAEDIREYKLLVVRKPNGC